MDSSVNGNGADKGKMIPVTGLWISASKKSIQGFLGDARLVIIPNKYKKESKHPDYLAYIAPNEKTEKKERVQENAATFEPFKDGDVPF